MPITKFVPNPDPPIETELPAEGFPWSEDALREWFRDRYGRAATELELGALMVAMSNRETLVRPQDPHPEPGGWRVEPALTRDKE